MTDGVVKTIAASCVHFVPLMPMTETVAAMATSAATIPAWQSGRRGASLAAKNPAPSAKAMPQTIEKILKPVDDCAREDEIPGHHREQRSDRTAGTIHVVSALAARISASM